MNMLSQYVPDVSKNETAAGKKNENSLVYIK